MATATTRSRGAVVVSREGTKVNRLGGGDGFGEIALLYATPRNATVTSTADTTVVGIDREAFLTALHASVAVHAAATRIATGRILEST
jgi:CRP-like cAMP-binding protein